MEHMQVVLASIIHQYFTDRYSYFCFSYEPHYYNWRRSKFQYGSVFSRNHITRGKIHYGGEKRLCKNTYSRFSPGKIGYIVIFPGGNSTI